MKIAAAPRILIVAALCVLSLVGLVMAEGNARAGGVEALLPMEAVDPRSLLSGHYVQLNLTQRLDEGEQCPPGETDAKWLALRRDGQASVLVGGAESREAAELISTGAVRGSFSCTPPTPVLDGPVTPGWVRLDIGIDRFYVNQTEALRIERVLRDQNINEATRAFAIVSIGRDGHARLKGLMIDGERLELSWL